MKRSLLKRKTPLKQVSDKMKVKLKEYTKVRKAFMESNPYCTVCGRPATDIHHMDGRTGDSLTDKANLISTCRFCHSLIHANPEWARNNGWLK